jgi:hypothetical protein
MKKSMLLAALAVLSISGGAMAITEGAPRPISVAGCPAGIASFFFVANVDGPAGACKYYMDWQSPFLPAGSAPCYVNELKALGQTSCLGNRQFNVTTAVLSTPGACTGFDQFGLIEDVQLVMSESFVSPTLNGLAVFVLFPFLPRPISIL